MRQDHIAIQTNANPKYFTFQDSIFEVIVIIADTYIAAQSRQLSRIHQGKSKTLGLKKLASTKMASSDNLKH